MKMDREICRALYQAEQELSPQLLHEMRNGTYSSLTRYHFTLGLWMRNHLLRADGSLYRMLCRCGISHPDDMSALLLSLLYLHLKGLLTEDAG